MTGKIIKADADRHLVFGWFSVAADKSGKAIVDSQGDTISIEELEKAAYDFVAHSGEAALMHETFNIGALVESCVFTPEKLKMLGLNEEALPQGWYGGFRITDENVWEKIKAGELTMFSLGGKAQRSE